MRYLPGARPRGPSRRRGRSRRPARRSWSGPDVGRTDGQGHAVGIRLGRVAGLGVGRASCCRRAPATAGTGRGAARRSRARVAGAVLVDHPLVRRDGVALVDEARARCRRSVRSSPSARCSPSLTAVRRRAGFAVGWSPPVPPPCRGATAPRERPPVSARPPLQPAVHRAGSPPRWPGRSGRRRSGTQRLRSSRHVHGNPHVMRLQGSVRARRPANVARAVTAL